VRRLILLLTLLTAALCGCGVTAQRTPETITVPAPRATGSTVSSSGPVVSSMFLVRGTSLQAVQRRTAAPGDLRQVLLQLADGPSSTEARGGLRTALAPQPISVLRRSDSGVLTLGVGRQFTAVTGGDQLLAVAQVVWTVCQFPWVQGVRFVTGGQELEVPTDRGLVQRAVTRNDYRTVAPPSGPATGTPAPPT
jgi:hypothetical protein